MQTAECEGVSSRRLNRPAPQVSQVDGSRQCCYVVVAAVARKSRRRRSDSRRAPVSVLVGPFFSEVHSRFIQTSAQALGLLVERVVFDTARDAPMST